MGINQREEKSSAPLMFNRLLKLFLVTIILISCSSREDSLTGSDEEIYNLILKEINKEKKYIILNNTDFELVEDMITTLQIRFPYSPYTREAYLLSADVAFKKKRYELAISEYREFINNQVNHPKIEYATFKILKSYSLLMSTKDKNEDPAKAILQIYDSLTAVYKSSEYMKETEKIYLKAKRYILNEGEWYEFDLDYGLILYDHIYIYYDVGMKYKKMM